MSETHPHYIPIKEYIKRKFRASFKNPRAGAPDAQSLASRSADGG
jgi:hypothetical protein